MKNIHIVLIVVLSGVMLAFTNGIHKKEKSEGEEIEKTVYGPIVVLELFTSQGCSSCPSADLLLEEVKNEYTEEVFALSYHVDYWNYIGWKDPFSKAEYAKKQREYNIKFRNRSNYTPQLVVNGKEHFVGSNSSKMYDKIDIYKSEKSTNQISLSQISPNKSNIQFDYKVQGSLKNRVIRTLLVIDERSTAVKRGENRNRTLKNSNIVVSERSFALEDAEGSMRISIPEIVTSNDKLNVIVLIEKTNYDITAAAKHNLLRQL